MTKLETTDKEHEHQLKVIDRLLRSKNQKVWQPFLQLLKRSAPLTHVEIELNLQLTMPPLID